MSAFCGLDGLFKISELVIFFFLLWCLFMLLGWLLVPVLVVAEFLSRLADLILHKIILSFFLTLLLSLVVIWLRMIVVLSLDYLFM
jgi:hypothetical protein